MQYLSVEGIGAPRADNDYAEAMGALFPVAYGIKFAAKAARRDFVVPPQSTQWWADDPSAFVEDRRAEWRWNAMIRMPDWVSEADVAVAMAAKQVSGVSLRRLQERLCYQCLHLRSFAAEAPCLRICTSG